MSSLWKPLAEGEVAIAHLSDLHFGSPGYQNVWKLVTQFLSDEVKPKLLLVTGDLVDTPKRRLYRKAYNELDHLHVPFFVCAGNHDRYRKGNRLRLLHPSTWFGGVWANPLFDGQFEGKVLLPGEARVLEIGQGLAHWKVGLLGVDSSRDADWSARGHVDEANFADIKRATRDKDWDLCIFLVHHHLLSVRRLEVSRNKSKRDLFNLTCLVNCGSLLEILAEAHVDLVLHGHEHAAHEASYGSFTPGCSQVRVVGAGSATGNGSVAGCSPDGATFNVVILSPDRSGRLRRVTYQSNGWRVEAEFRLFEPSSARHSWLYRARTTDLKDNEVTSEIIKHVEFTRERHIYVRLVYTNWLPGVDFKQDVFNSTGVPDEVNVRLIAPGGHEVSFEDLRPERCSDDHTWSIRWTVPESHKGKPVTIETVYRWCGGAVLTEEELRAVRAGPAGELRAEGFEFAAIHVRGAVAAAELIVSLPPEYAPGPGALDVRVQEQGRRYEHEEVELRPRLRALAKGRYALRVPYPRTMRVYSIVWRPPSEKTSPAQVGYQAFHAAAYRRDNKLLQTFGDAFKSTPLWGQTTLALYLKVDNPMTLVRAAYAAPGRDRPPPAKPPEKVDLASDRSGLAKAWWGAPIEVNTPGERGLLPGEKAVFCAPVRFGVEWTNPPYWGVVRVGVLSDAGREWVKDELKLWTFASVGTMKMLTEALQPATI